MQIEFIACTPPTHSHNTHTRRARIISCTGLAPDLARHSCAALHNGGRWARKLLFIIIIQSLPANMLVWHKRSTIHLYRRLFRRSFERKNGELHHRPYRWMLYIHIYAFDGLIAQNIANAMQWQDSHTRVCARDAVIYKFDSELKNAKEKKQWDRNWMCQCTMTRAKQKKKITTRNDWQWKVMPHISHIRTIASKMSQVPQRASDEIPKPDDILRCRRRAV